MTMTNLRYKVLRSVTADVAVSYAGWTLTVDQNGIDNLFDDSQQEDMSRCRLNR
jgi:hypothetical protein